jgi:hypothetical protein
MPPPLFSRMERREHAADAAHEEHRCECGHDACTMAAV